MSWNNPLVRLLAVIVAIAAGIRLVFELLKPVWPYLVALLIVAVGLRVVGWYRGRW